MSTRTIATSANEGNNFDLLRLFAASSVIFSHSFGLVQRSAQPYGDPIYDITHHQMTFGELGVFIFFICSGFLITASVQRSAGLPSYFAKRMLRIVPGLVFVVVLSIVLLGPLLTTLPLADYFSQRETYTYLRNILMFAAQPELPGVFANNPVIGMVNGSLWTLKFEVFCYVFIAVLNQVRGLHVREVILLAIATTIAGHVYHGVGSGYLFYLGFFLSGSALSLLQKHMPVSFPAFAALGAIVILSTPLGWLHAACALAGSYCVLYLAYVSRHGTRLRRHIGDYSYGIYLFGFPVQQAVIQLAGPTVTWYQVFLVAYPITIVLALVSWKVVEEPAMHLRERLALRLHEKLAGNH